MSGYAIVANDISKKYRMFSNQNKRLLELLFSKDKTKYFYALKGVTFAVEHGDSVGLIGLNGSGKSTLANILGKVAEPSSGSISIDGIPTVISIGAGLNAQLTGRENIEYKGLLIGLTHKQIVSLMDEIISFADIGEFIDQPVKVYSSGMRARLGFSISVNIDPDILIIDEALSVGDPSFTQKCLDKMNSFRERGKTIFFVSHSPNQISEFCNKAIWLEYGILKAYGRTEEVMPMYKRFLYEYNLMSKKEQEDYKKKTMLMQENLIKE